MNEADDNQLMLSQQTNDSLCGARFKRRDNVGIEVGIVFFIDDTQSCRLLQHCER
jgi:hypothetical protein